MITRIRKASTFIILLFVLSLQYAAAQSSETIHVGQLRIRGAGLLSGRTEKVPAQRLVRLYTVGGFITILPDSTFSQSQANHYFRLYNTKNKAGAGGQIFSGTPIQIYLNVGQQYVIASYDRKNDTTIDSYIIKRIQLVPELMLYSRENGHVISTRIAAKPDKPAEIQVRSGKRIAIGPAGIPAFDGIEIDYVLTDLKTKKTLNVVGNNGLGPVHLENNRSYQLSFRYTLQRETTAICYISVLPRWYQSPYLYMSFSVLMAAAIFIAILTIYKKQLRSSKAAQDKLEDAAIKLQSLLNPHFTFNALSTIQGLMNTGRIDEANLYLQEFSSLLRKALSKSQQVLNTLDQELDMMRLYIGLEALRFNFSWQIEVADSLHPADIEIPTLLLQPLIENAIKHGMASVGGKGQLRIICKKGDKKDSLVIIISDNGTWKQTGSKTGYGLRLTEARIQTANKLFHNTQSISLTFNKQSGTAAVLTFYNWINQ